MLRLAAQRAGAAEDEHPARLDSLRARFERLPWARVVCALQQTEGPRSSPGEARPVPATPDLLTVRPDDPLRVPEVDRLRKTNDMVITVTGLRLSPLLIASFGVMFWRLFFR